MAALPLDIIVDVLSKLPTQSLCRFKCLSKLFRALITNPRFVKIHQTKNQQTRTLVLVDVVKSLGRNSLLRTDFDSKIITEDQLDFPIKESSFDCLRICCSCNGSLCLSLRDETATETFFIYNCSTREFKRIPNDYEPFTNRDTLLVSLGYAQSIDEFKVLGFSDSYRNAKAVVAVNVFSLRNNTWNASETNFKFFHHCSRATNLNGTVHFGFCKLNCDYMIAAFDLAKDKFKFLALPDNVCQYHSKYSYSIIGNCLCLISESTLWWKEFWIMKEYGVRESWTRISLANSIQALQPLCSMKGSDFILSILDEKFVLIDPKDGKKYEDFMIDGF